MSIIKKPYEISLWDDVLVFVVDLNGTKIEYEEKLPSNINGTVVAQYYKEKKICTIGSNSMNTPIRATSGKLVSKVNGENTLTFNMYSHYLEEDGKYYENPFIKLLINERKVKLRYGAPGREDTKWYDFVIKNIQKNSETKTYSYTAKDLFVNELSKSGFNLQLDTELGNNMGNITKLASTILEESDWELKENDLLEQTLEEPLYQLRLNQQIVAKNMKNDEDTLTIGANQVIYAFYTDITNQSSYLQFLYSTDPYKYNDDYVITNSKNWFYEGVEYDSASGLPSIASTCSIDSKYRGARLVRKVRTEYDATIDKYVTVYEQEENGEKVQIYGYTETEYTSPASVRSYITNPNSYDSSIGWEIGGAKVNEVTSFPNLKVVSVPDVRDVLASDILEGKAKFASCLEIEITNQNQKIYNSGIVDYRQYINGFTQGDKYVFRIKYGVAGSTGQTSGKTYSLTNGNIGLTFNVAEYTLSEGVYTLEDIYFTGQIASTEGGELVYRQVEATCNKSLSYSEMITKGNSLGLFIQTTSSSNCTIYIEDVQFFPSVKNNDDTLLLPDQIKTGEVKTRYLYYKPNKNYKSIDEVEYIYKDYTPATFAQVYNDNEYEKVRSINASESNRFNMIQELCEIFECWPKFEVEHNSETGKILLGKDRKDENGNPIECSEEEKYRQQKWVSFHGYIGKPNHSGFKYGINLKSIQRTIDSEAIVSKMIVKDNSNEFGKDGFCSIARASENPNGENFLLDFSYYIQHELLGLSEITNDLYLENNEYLGYYKKLKRINTKRDEYIEEQVGLLTDISEYQAKTKTYQSSVESANKQLRDKYVFIKSLTGYEFEQLMNDKSNDWWENDQVISTVASIGRLNSIITNHEALYNAASQNLRQAQSRYELLDRILTSREESENEDRLLLQKEELNKKFYKKYSRFLQEGPWISEDYIDDNLYFLDAQSTLHTSSQPKVTYNISVLELSQIKEYENYVFALGDKTTIEDTEFFGWTFKSGVRTPYKEEIVVTELTVVLDSPEQNQIKVQNYKTQFEDLFQRMAATTQSVEYSTGKYQKVSNIVEEDGTINIVTLQNSIANNALILQNAKDQSVVWDETGITTTSLTKPAEMVRIVSGGVFLSVDGGITWNTGITGEGINASMITSGRINTEEINILNGAFPSFRWDSSGISAYEFTMNGDIVQNFNYSKFVRLDQYGLYGINGYSNFDATKADSDGLIGEDKIWKNSNFALTWRGFQIKSNDEGGYISITSSDDFQVKGTNGEEYVKIGQLYKNTDNTIYGLRLTSWETENGIRTSHIVLEQANDGKVWIRDELEVGTGAAAVRLGYLKDTKSTNYRGNHDYKNVSADNIHQVINANNKFMVYEDGSMKATDGEFTGVIYATGGEIGGVKIESFVNPNLFQVSIEVEDNSGPVFDAEDQRKTLIARLYKNKTEITEGITGYVWYKNNEVIEGANSQSITVAEEEVENSAFYTCEIEYNG